MEYVIPCIMYATSEPVNIQEIVYVVHAIYVMMSRSVAYDLGMHVSCINYV